jgi:hypothetical protein
MKRYAPLFMTITLGACASSGNKPDTSPPVEVMAATQRIVSPMDNTKLIGGTVAAAVAVGVSVTAPANDVFTALQAVYKEMAIPEGTFEPAARTIGNQQFRVRRKLAGQPMTKWMDCGTASGQPNAETYDIQFSLISYVTVTDAKTSLLTTRVSGAGNDPAFGRGNQVMCNTQGNLEKYIEAQVKAKLGVK